MAGFLKGFVTIHPKRGGFSKADYIAASANDTAGTIMNACLQQIILHPGDFDLRGYELVRSQIINNYGQISVTVASLLRLLDMAVKANQCSNTISDCLPVRFYSICFLYDCYNLHLRQRR